VDNTLKQKFESARKYFPHINNVVYFNTASYGPFSTLVNDAIVENLNIRMSADKDDSHYVFSIKNKLRKGYADLIGAEQDDVGIGQNTTFGLNVAAFGLPLNEGDEVLVSDIEFPALAYVWRAAAEERKLKLKFVKSNERFYSIEKLEESITEKTKVVSVSFVQFFNGYKNDLAAISEICKKNNLYFVVDGIQGMGVEPINVKELGIDIFSSGCQKWMLSPQGCSFFYLSENIRNRLSNHYMSWLSADWKVEFTNLFRYDLPYFDSSQRYEMGYFGTLNLLGMNASLSLFENLGIDNIQIHNYELIDDIIAYLNNTDYYTITSSTEDKHRSSILTFTCDKLKELHRFLLDNKIILVEREGSIRVSVHLFNNKEDVDKLIQLLDDFKTDNK
jgi:selenocysteine lyase/cysteine desulfurase